MRNERGSLFLAIVMGLAMLAGSMAMFDYLKSSYTILGYMSDRSRMEPAQNFVFARLKHCLTLESLADCPKASQFKTLMTLPGTLIAEGTVAPVAPITLTKAEMESVSGFLSVRQNEIDQTFSDFTAKIERQNSVDDPVTGSTRVSITLSMKPIGHTVSLQSRELSRSYRVTIQTPLSFGLMLRSPTNPAILLTGNGDSHSAFNVIGGSLIYNDGSSYLRPGQVVQGADADFVRMDRTLTTSPAIEIDDAGDRASFHIFNNNILPYAFAGAYDPFYTMTAWAQPMDYAYVFSSGGYPLPASVSLSGTNYTPAHATNCDRKANWNKATGAAENRTGVTTFPSTLVMGSSSLNETCARPDSFAEGSMKALVLLRAGENLTFDYTAQGGSQYACGMVIADKITFVVPPAQTVVWYGHINASQVEVNGGGHLVILNPFSAATKGGDLPAPPNLAISELQTLFITLGSSTAHNFFVPFTRNPANLPTNIGYSMAATNFQFPASATSCASWQLTVDPPDLAPYLQGATWDQELFFSAEEGL